MKYIVKYAPFVLVAGALSYFAYKLFDMKSKQPSFAGKEFIAGIRNLPSDLVGLDNDYLWGDHPANEPQIFNQNGKVVQYTYWELQKATARPVLKPY